VDIVNLPGYIYFGTDCAIFSHSLCICGYKAHVIVVNGVGGVQKPIPDTCKL